MGDRCAEIVLFFSVSNTQGERGGKEERRGEEEEEEEEEGRGRGGARLQPLQWILYMS